MKTENLTTDELFKELPSFINDEGTLYHFKLIKGSKRIIIDYVTNGGSKSLSRRYWTGDTLYDALKETLDWLIKYGYYKKESENILLDMIKMSKK